MSIIVRVLLMVTFMITVLGLLQAQSPPQELEGQFHGDHNSIELQWHHPDGDNDPQFYNVYRKAGGDTSFQLLSAAGDDKYEDGQITLHATYQYHVTAVYSGNIESSPSNTVEVTVFPDSAEDSSQVALHFTSAPVLIAFINQAYSYDADVEAIPATGDICFSLHEGPAGMTIDGTTGLVSWTPASLGVFEVEIRSRVCSGGEGEAEQEYNLMVVSGTPGSIGGVVRDTAGAPLPHVKIKIFDVTAGVFVLKTYSDSTGHYLFPFVNPGTYFVKADPDGEMLHDQWFDGVDHMEDATPVAVVAGETMTVNFTLQGENEVEQDFHLTGTVMDLSSNPISGALVSASRTDDDEDAFEGLFDDNHDDHHRRHGEDRSAVSDSAGRYSLTLRGGTYIVSAAAEGFLGQFWDHEPSPLEANVIDLHRDTSDIDFNLSPAPEGHGSIAGFVRSAVDGGGLESHVTGFQRDSAGHLTGFVSFDESDSTGFYRLDHLPAGDYIILAHDGHDFVPTFYSSTGGTPLLGSATPVAVNGDAVTGIDIFVQADSSEGLNSMSGEVESEPGGSAASPESVTPLAGAIVTLLNGQAQPVGSAVSGPEGTYTVPGIAPGTYAVIFQKPGRSSVTATAVVAYTNNLPTLTTLNAQLVNSAGNEIVNILSLQKSWNLVSLPLTVADYSKSVLFPTSLSAAFGYDGAYHSADVLTNGAGYWLKFSAANAGTIPIVGTQRLSDTVDVVPGWNLIGSVSSPVNISGIVSIPAGMSTSQFFGYQGSYVVSGTIEPGRGYWVNVKEAGKLILSAGSQAQSGTIRVIATSELPPGVPEDRVQGSVLPTAYALAQNFPNPFNPTTTVQFDIPAASRITVKVYNILGEQVRVLADNASYDQGRYELSFDASALSSGVYYYRLDAAGATGSYTQVKKMMLLK